MSINMVGLPEETPANVLETVKLNALSHVTSPQVSIFYPFPGTKLAKYCEEKGYVRPFRGDVYDYFSDSSLDMPTLSREQIVAYRLSFRPFMQAYRALYRLTEPVRRIPEKVLDAVYTSRYHTFLAMKVMQPSRHLYGSGVRLLFQRLRRRLRAGSTRHVELGAAPVLKGHDVCPVTTTRDALNHALLPPDTPICDPYDEPHLTDQLQSHPARLVRRAVVDAEQCRRDLVESYRELMNRVAR